MNVRNNRTRTRISLSCCLRLGSLTRKLGLFSIPFTLLLVSPLYLAQHTSAQPRLPHVSQEMERPEFWIRKVPHPESVILESDEIRSMNERNLKNQSLYLFDVRGQKESLTKEEMLALFKEDWEGFGRPEALRYGKDGKPLTRTFWNNIERKLNKESIQESHPFRFGLIVRRTDIRVFPTYEVCKLVPDEDGFDVFQHSAVSPGSLVGIYHSTKDGVWAYIQTHFVRGWVQSKDLAIARDAKEALEYDGFHRRLVVTGSFAKVFADPEGRTLAFSSQMGSSFPLMDSPNRAEKPYVIQIPIREDSGALVFRMGYVPRSEDVHPGFLPLTQRNIAQQAFKMLHEPYGWGETGGGRDCSRFVMDLFASFGIVMPRNSKYQAMMGEDLGLREEMEIKEKLAILDQAPPLATLLRLPGHIMLYLGKHQGRYYVIHSLWSIQQGGSNATSFSKIGRVAVSDLSLGESGPNGSLLHRITDARSVTRKSRVP